VLRHCDFDLRWLVYTLPHAGEQLISGTHSGKGNVSQLLEPDRSALTRLRAFAAEWTSRFKNAPSEPQGFVRESINQRWEPWLNVRNAYVKQAGILILQVVDALEVKEELLRDRNFVRQVVQSLDGPEYLPDTRKVKSGERLTEFIDELARVADQNDVGHTPAHKVEISDSNAPAETSWMGRLGDPIAESPSGALKLFGPQHSVVVCGVEYKKLTIARYDVLFTLCKAGAAGLTMQELIHRSKRKSAVDILRTLERQDERWASVIMRGGVSGGGYRVV
jgi:hypothetical protein